MNTIIKNRPMAIIAAFVIVATGYMLSGSGRSYQFGGGGSVVARPPIFIDNDRLELTVNDMIIMLKLTKIEVKKMATENADKIIFNHAISSTKWFTDKYYTKRDNPEALIDAFYRYISKPEHIEIFILNLAGIIDMKLKEVTADCIAKAAGIDTVSVSIEYSNGTLYDYIKNRIPGAEEMNKAMYDEMIKKITTEKRDHFTKMYEEFREKYPQLDICAEAFIVACEYIRISNIDEYAGKIPDVLISQIPMEQIGYTPDTINVLKCSIYLMTQMIKTELAYVGGKMKFKEVMDDTLRNLRHTFIDYSEKCVVNIINKVILRIPKIYESGKITIDLKGGNL